MKQITLPLANSYTTFPVEELQLRLVTEDLAPYKDCAHLNSPQSVYYTLQQLWDKNTFNRVESMYVLFLNSGMRLIGYTMISTGGIASTIVDVRIILQTALLSNATKVIMAHNHPSGSVLPSQEDINMTKNACAALKLCNIRLVDHVILGGSAFYSFADETALIR